MNTIQTIEASTTNRDHPWDVMCHLAALLIFTPIPFGNILGPLVVWLIKRGDSPAVNEHGKESLNFQISLALYLFAATLVTIALMFVLIGFLMLPFLILLWGVAPFVSLVFIIIAAIKAGDGVVFRYPFTLRLIT